MYSILFITHMHTYSILFTYENKCSLFHKEYPSYLSSSITPTSQMRKPSEPQETCQERPASK